jgi:nucleoid-associated protein YgaU
MTQIYSDPKDWRELYSENAEKIIDPDLIYPGQTLTFDPNAE